MKNKFNFDHKKVSYELKENGQFVINNYNFAKPFSSFFPGIAGLYGIPMWAFYVNRGQCVCGFGVNSKDQPIMEFLPANKAYQMVFQRGFRTLIKIKNNKKESIFYEPFQNSLTNINFEIRNTMSISFDEFNIEEENFSLGLKTRVQYFTIPLDSYAALVRLVTIKNTKATRKHIEVIDGMPIIIPYGVNNMFLKKLGRTIEAWMGVENLETGVPFYRLKVDPTDRPEVIHIKKGNFYLSFYGDKKPVIVKPIVDPDCIFSGMNDLSFPYEFLKESNFSYPKKQITQSKTPCAFSFVKAALKKGEDFALYTIVGNMGSLDKLNKTVPRIANRKYIDAKRKENKLNISRIMDSVQTLSSSFAFNHYVQQTFLDNVVRGGFPITLNRDKSEVIYVYSRKHGDLERDYNKFMTRPTYFSQGDGNYRDVNQNRRNDIFFNADIKDSNIITFFNLIQLDGFNPLVLKGIGYHFEDKSKVAYVLDTYVEGKYRALLEDFFLYPFYIGQLFLFLEEHNIDIKDRDSFIREIITLTIKELQAEHKEGFWTDHWTYNIDLLERYFALYPENLREILLEKKSFSFYDDCYVVNPRKEKYVLYNNKPRQLNSVVINEEKKKMLQERQVDPHKVRVDFGKGEIFRTNLLVKLLCLIVNKLSSLDPFGVGIEMEANKPNWYDALNGLPALFGSSISETMELKRLIIFLKDALKNKLTISDEMKFDVPEEIFDYCEELHTLLREEMDAFEYWDKSYVLKEGYRNMVLLGLSGIQKQISVGALLRFFEKALLKLDKGIANGFDHNKLCSTYFINDVIEYDRLNKGQSSRSNHRNNNEIVHIRPRKFRQKPLPLFLEGFVHALRIAKNKQEKESLYAVVKNSALFDRKLGMYKVNASLEGQPEEMGRTRVFTSGWLENESIWLHMEYKYLLELLKSELYDEFYNDFFKILIPFQDPQRYGRSILENSSFLVSSVFPDEQLHGNGFVARLSGSTAECVHIWLEMSAGSKPFLLNEKGQIYLEFKPILHKDLFTKKKQTIAIRDGENKEKSIAIEKDSYAFRFLGKTLVAYHNPKRLNTFGKNKARITKIILKDIYKSTKEVTSSIIPTEFAVGIRDGLFTRIDIYLS